ncbi:MAG: RDD family protein [Pseudomonadales bacterium]
MHPAKSTTRQDSNTIAASQNRASATPAQPLYAPLYRRLFAMIYDLLLLAAVLFCVAGAYFTVLLLFQAGGVSSAALAAAQTGDVLREIEVIEPGWPFYPLMATVYIGFFVYFWHATGQTLGMRAWKICLQDSAGEKPGLLQLFVRLPAALLSLACAGMGYWIVLLPGVTQCWHDKLSRTHVVMVRG